ncbi:hypothetical protein DERF_001445 [Dermatophagoides farinae]|uniref:Uncharacterized protein n=1 Tax=Dermatophagoides farinae TaxID=6954 RepID=A0A922I9H9_DERFA|nr:hypothetical protein DERF_001445 [Dermatophagoides farinae]
MDIRMSNTSSSLSFPSTGHQHIEHLTTNDVKNHFQDYDDDKNEDDDDDNDEDDDKPDANNWPQDKYYKLGLEIIV